MNLPNAETDNSSCDNTTSYVPVKSDGLDRRNRLITIANTTVITSLITLVIVNVVLGVFSKEPPTVFLGIYPLYTVYIAFVSFVIQALKQERVTFGFVLPRLLFVVLLLLFVLAFISH